MNRTLYSNKNIELIQALERELVGTQPKPGELSKFSIAYVYYQLENIANFYKGEFMETTGNIDFLRVTNNFFQLAFLGDVYVTYDEINKFRLFTLLDKEKKIYREYKTNKQYVIKDDKLVCFNLGLGNLWMQWYQVFKRENELFNIWLLNAYTDAKKFIRVVNSSSKEIEQAEINKFFDTSTPFIDTYSLLSGNINGFQNNIQELQKGSSATALSFDNITQHFKFFADRLGFSTAQESKKERLTQGENIINTHNTNNLMNVVWRELKIFTHDIKEKFGITLSFERYEEFNTNEDSSIKVEKNSQEQESDDNGNN